MLQREKAEVTTTRLSKTDPLSDAEVDDLIRSVHEVILARGKSFRVLPASQATRDDLRGPTGGFRAPMVKKGKRLLVGFHEETLHKVLT
ncbi:MAG: hypothetical protein ABIT01_14990 [Thermoanaerobaculia bacterium]